MNEQQQPPRVEQRAESPPGSVPKNRQTWIMMAIAATIVLAVVFSGSTESRPNTTSSLPAPVHTPSKAEIDRYTQALRAEELRLRQAQAEATRSRETFQQQVEASGMQGGIPGQGTIGPAGQTAYGAGPVPVVPPQKSAIEEDREKREYASAFASNIALSYRNAGPEQNRPDATKEAAKDTAKETVQAGGEESSGKAKAAGGAAPSVAASRPLHPLFEGTIVEAVLTNRLEGSFSGPVNCQVTADVYSHDRQHLLIPKGSRVLGEARRVQEQDQQRLAIVFHRLIMPDGYALSLDRVPGLDQAGATGLKDKVNHHYLSTFGTSVVLGLLAGFSMTGTRGVFTADAEDQYRQGVANQLGRDSTRILDRQLNRMPTITIREGTRVRILLTGDIALPAWQDHLSARGTGGEL